MTDPDPAPGSPAWRAVEVLADAWRPALETSYRFGWADGHRAGVTEGRAEESQTWQQIMGVWREGLNRRDIERQPPCTRCGNCSNCIRADWVRRHGGDYRGAA